MLKNILLTFGLIVGAIFSRHASAQALPEGPFQNQSQLVSAWQQFDVYGAGYVFLDGNQVFQRSGFGPPAVGYYYTCPGEGLIRRKCPMDGPFSSVNDITEYWSQWAASTITATSIYLNGQLIYQYQDGFGPAMVKHYVYCYNRGAYMTNCWL